MKIGIGDRQFIEVDAFRTFGQSGIRYKWLDWVRSKREANAKVGRLRKQGHLVRVVPIADGYSIYTHAR